MRHGTFKLLGLILIFVLQLHLAGCAGGSGGASGGGSAAANFPVVVFSDVHFNPFYDTTLFAALNAADPSQWAEYFSGIEHNDAFGVDQGYQLSPPRARTFEHQAKLGHESPSSFLPATFSAITFHRPSMRFTTRQTRRTLRRRTSLP